MLKKTLPTLILLLTGAACAWAGGISLTVEGASAYALDRNAGLAAARLRIDEARGRLRQAGRFANPELEAEYRQNVRTSENAMDVALKQRFPMTGRLRLEKAVSIAQLAAAEAEVRDAARLLAAEVRTAAVRLLALRARHALTERQLANSRELAEFMTKRARLGEVPATDAQQVDLDAAQLTTELLRLDAEHSALAATLCPLLGVSAQTSVEITGVLAEPNPSDWRRASGERPDFTAAQYQADAAQQQAALAKAQRWEDLEVGLLASFDRAEDAPGGIERDTMLGVRLSLPLPFWNRNEGRIAETAAAATRARQAADALAARAAGEAFGTRAELRALAKLAVQLDAVLLPKAAQIETQLRSAYNTGQAALTEVLRARDQRLQLRRQQLDALRDYHLARIRHAAATGAILTQSKSK